MNYFQLVILGFCLVLSSQIPCVASIENQTCGFVGMDSNTPENPHRLDPISDFAKEGEILLIYATYNCRLTGTIGDAEGHYRYLGAAFSGGSTQRYYIRGNARSKNFTREKKTRSINRGIRLYCDDDISDFDYYFVMPVLDVTPPEFSSDLYTIDLKSDWNRSLPIAGDSIRVSDNAFELGDNPDLLKIKADPSEGVRVEQFGLGETAEHYHFGVDIFLSENLPLIPGTTLNFTLNARDENNTASADLVINVIQ